MGHRLKFWNLWNLNPRGERNKDQEKYMKKKWLRIFQIRQETLAHWIKKLSKPNRINAKTCMTKNISDCVIVRLLKVKDKEKFKSSLKRQDIYLQRSHNKTADFTTKLLKLEDNAITSKRCWRGMGWGGKPTWIFLPGWRYLSEMKTKSRCFNPKK